MTPEERDIQRQKNEELPKGTYKVIGLGACGIRAVDCASLDGIWDVELVAMDMDWKPLDYYDAVFPRYEEIPPKPPCLEKLGELAAKLSKGWNYVRVDFYVLDNGDIKFGEMTFTPGSGQYTWNPPEADLFMGEKIVLPIEK